jgi:hypothetical protein
MATTRSARPSSRPGEQGRQTVPRNSCLPRKLGQTRKCLDEIPIKQLGWFMREGGLVFSAQGQIAQEGACARRGRPTSRAFPLLRRHTAPLPARVPISLCYAATRLGFAAEPAPYCAALGCGASPVAACTCLANAWIVFSTGTIA